MLLEGSDKHSGLKLVHINLLLRLKSTETLITTSNDTGLDVNAENILGLCSCLKNRMWGESRT
jgi:hypothetical protein